jgi:predicted DNA repair protein MutK
MSDQAYEIVCPICKSVVPDDAPQCPTCAAKAAAARAAEARTSAAASPVAPSAAPALAEAAPAVYVAGAASIEGASTLKLKDYHRLVRSNYGRVEPRGPATAFGSPLVPALLIIVLGLIVGAVIVFGWLG